MSRTRVLTIVGTRPEAIKLAPVIRQLDGKEDIFEHRVVATSQHREMLDQALTLFGISPHVDLDLMGDNQSLAAFASRSLLVLSNLFLELKPDAILVQGDTTTAMTAALAAFYQGVRVAHVEAGLRSFDRRSPFPEELNRRVVGCVADLHFAPTEIARQNLLREGVSDESIFVTGNTIVDALQSVTLADEFDEARLRRISFDKPVILVTVHRRENYGEALRSICQAFKELIARFPEIQIVYPIHLNPNIRNTARQELNGTERIHLLDPISYRDLLQLMSRCYLILSDSGGIQEEAPSFHKPVLVLREVTERPELVTAGLGKLIGTSTARIVAETERLLTDASAYRAMTTAENPFGNGQAAKRIVEVLAERL